MKYYLVLYLIAILACNDNKAQHDLRLDYQYEFCGSKMIFTGRDSSIVHILLNVDTIRKKFLMKDYFFCIENEISKNPLITEVLRKKIKTISLSLISEHVSDVNLELANYANNSDTWNGKLNHSKEFLTLLNATEYKDFWELSLNRIFLEKIDWQYAVESVKGISGQEMRKQYGESFLKGFYPFSFEILIYKE